MKLYLFTELYVESDSDESMLTLTIDFFSSTSSLGSVLSEALSFSPSFFLSISVLGLVFPFPSVRSDALDDPARKTVRNIVNRSFSGFGLDVKER